MSKSGIYKIKNIINNKVYIGSTNNLTKRLREHKSSLKNGNHYNYHLQNAYELYKIENFEFSILEECNSEFLLERENYYINFYNSKDPNFGYNVMDAQNGFLGQTHSEETKEKLRKLKTGCIAVNRKFTEEEVILIRKEFYNGTRIGELSKRFNIDRNRLTDIIELKSYKNIPVKIEGYEDFIKQKQKDYKNGKRPHSTGWKHSKEFIEKFRKAVSKPNKILRKLTEEDILDIRKKKSEGFTCKQLSKEYGVNQNTISRIVRKLIYKDIT